MGIRGGVRVERIGRLRARRGSKEARRRRRGEINEVW